MKIGLIGLSYPGSMICFTDDKTIIVVDNLQKGSQVEETKIQATNIVNLVSRPIGPIKSGEELRRERRKEQRKKK